MPSEVLKAPVKGVAGTNSDQPVPSKKALKRRAKTRSGWVIHGAQIAIVIILIVAWEIAATNMWIDPFFYGQPTVIWDVLVDWVKDGSLLTNTAVTFSEAAIGFFLATFTAVPVGIFLARSNFWGRVANPFIDICNSTPRFALAPLFVLIFGLGMAPKVILVFSVVFFVMLINTVAGVKSIDENLIRMSQLMNASGMQTFSKVILPSTGEWLVAAIRLAAPYSLAAALVGEMISSTEGLGYLIVRFAGLLQISSVFAAVFVLAMCGWALNAFVSTLALRSPWMKGSRDASVKRQAV